MPETCCHRAPARNCWSILYNILIPTRLWVRKIHVGTRIKCGLGDYGLLY